MFVLSGLYCTLSAPLPHDVLTPCLAMKEPGADVTAKSSFRFGLDAALDGIIVKKGLLGSSVM